MPVARRRPAAGRAALVRDEARARRRLDELDRRSRPNAAARFLRICETVSFAHAKRHRPLRPQAGERDARRFRRGAGDGLGRGARDRRERRSRCRHARLHGPRAGAGAIVDASTDVFALGAMLRAILPSNVPRPLRRDLRESVSGRARRIATRPCARSANDIANWLDGQP